MLLKNYNWVDHLEFYLYCLECSEIGIFSYFYCGYEMKIRKEMPLFLNVIRLYLVAYYCFYRELILFLFTKL